MGQLKCAVLLSLILSFHSLSTHAGELCIGSWNVENLFDTEDDPSVELDEDFTPTSPKQWTPEKLDVKLTNLAKIISKVNGGHGPDVLGLVEIENRKVIELLVAKLAPLGRNYEIVHKDSPSDRGIDTALIYDAKVLKLADSKFHFVDAEKTRDILEAKFRRTGSGDSGAVLYVFVNHWPSRRNVEQQRLTAATVARKRLDEILAADPKADFVLIGDFNDEVDNESIAKILRASKTEEIAADGSLYDTTAPIAIAGKGTFVFDDKWNMLDHIIISPGLLDGEGFAWRTGSSKLLDFPELFSPVSSPAGIHAPVPSYSYDEFNPDGYSDHIAEFCIIDD